jgi:predicted esterase
MAYRAAAHYRADGLIILAADVPPDVVGRDGFPAFAEASAGKPPILIGRGTTDAWYTEAKQAVDLAALAGIGARVTACVFDGGHEWTDVFRAAAAAMLAGIRAGR